MTGASSAGYQSSYTNGKMERQEQLTSERGEGEGEVNRRYGKDNIKFWSGLRQVNEKRKCCITMQSVLPR